MYFAARARKNARTLSKFETRYKEILENLPQGVVILDRELRIVNMNKAMREILPHADASEKPFCYQTVGGTDAKEPFWYCPSRSALLDGEMHKAVAICEIQGCKRLMRIVSCPIKDSRGKVESLVEFFDDMTEYLESQKALEQQLQFKQSLLHTAPMPIYYRDSQGKYIDCNKAYEDFIGLRRQDIIGHEAAEFFAPDIVARGIAVEQELLRGERDMLTEEVQLPLPNGEFRDIIMSKASFLDAEYKPAGVVTVITDISEFKKIQRSLREAEEKYRTLFVNAMLGIFRASTSGDLLEANPSLVNLLGYESQAELLQSNLSKGFGFFLDPGQKERVLGQLADSGIVSRLEAVFRSEFGEEFHGNFSAHMVRDDGGAPLHIDGVLEDVSERKMAEENLLRAKIEAEEASSLKSDFITAVSHELRTPLTSVLGFAKILNRKLEKDIFPFVEREKGKQAVQQVRTSLEMLKTDAERLGYLINDVLDLSTLEAGRKELFLRKVSVPELLRRAASSLSREFEAAEVELELDVPANLPAILCDGGQILDVLRELLENALKFSKGSMVALHAELVSDAKGGMVAICVQDSGAGIPREKQAEIFEIFTQLGGSLTDKPQGAGLGLPICTRVVTLHGGELTVHSDPGKGCRFRFTLPASE